MNPEWAAVGLTVAVQLVGYGMLVQRVRDHDKAIADHETRLRELEPQVLKVQSHTAGR